jgi:hypothetical protein
MKLERGSMTRVRENGRRAPALLLAIAAVVSGAGGAVLGVCGPFNDVAADSFCPFVIEDSDARAKTAFR